MQQVEERVSDGRTLSLLRNWLEQDVLREMERWTPTRGTPQGAVISPLLANIYLHPLDERMAARGYRMVRYADDFVVLCKSREEAEAALEEVCTWVADNGLHLQTDKTHIGDCRQPGQGFEFLGYRFEAGRRFVRKKSLDRLKDNIRMRTRRTRGVNLTRVIADLNPMLRGWFGYFKHAHPRTFVVLDKFIRRRLRSFLRKQEKRPGFALCPADHQRWQRLLRPSRAARASHSLANRETIPDAETTNWRAVCGKIARTVRRAGRLKAFPTLSSQNTRTLIQRLELDDRGAVVAADPEGDRRG